MTKLRLLGSFLLLAVPGLAFAGNDPKGIEFFEAKIRPVLSKYCYECHSASAKKLKADLLLDSKAGMLTGGDHGPALVPGKAKDSLLIKALEHAGPKMPSQSVKLPKEIIADFAKWIDMGAPDPRDGKIVTKKKTYDIEKARDYWAFKPLGNVSPPLVKTGTWTRTPIDRYILAKLEEKGLTPNGPLAAERLLRRAHFDLTGLPPTPIEVEEFTKAWDTAGAKRGEIWAQVIDRLLQSERHGERWARHWLDVVRFAESGGYEFDGNRPAAYHYRDFVIKAMNDDMPFDQFLRWQIAGDQLVPGDLNAIAATGFLVAGSYPGQTTSKTLALIRYDHLDDMVSTLGTSMLGLSLGCARCHEHKYDPIPQEDYYRLVAALGRTDSANLKVNTNPGGYKKAKDAFDLAHAPLLKARDNFEKNELPKLLQTFWNANKDKSAGGWLTLVPIATQGAVPDGKGPATIRFTAQTAQRKIKALRFEAGDKTGDFILSEINVTATPMNAALKAKIKPINVKLKAGQASASDPKNPLAAAVDGNPKTSWSATSKSAATFEFDGDIGFDGGTILTIALQIPKSGPFAIVDTRFAISTSSATPINAPAIDQTIFELSTALQPTQGVWKADQRDGVLPWVRRINPDAEMVYAAVEKSAKDEPKPTLIDVFAAQSGRGGPVNFLIRGEPEKKREVVNPGFAQVLTSATINEKKWLVDKTDPRVSLANWLTDTEHGAGNLVARVIVNRLWQHHMGKGLVATPNDFGVQGDPPTHPELLDYLAKELIRNGWRLKPIHKLIMTSAVYMQSNATSEQAMKIDPANKLWWRRPTRRLEAEAIRDNLLAIAGTLDLKMYGPGTLDGNTPRRSVYLTVKRSQMVPFLTMFDVPEALQSIGERSVTTVPTQSLAFMNSPLVRGAAQKLATRVKAKTDEESVEQAYLIVLARRPTDSERQRMVSFIARQAESYGKAPQARDQA
ncbi:MAG: PSD1 domain-containing protein, partial [Planctomycetes bacterium]|nr:PSD1 domain-containing protein [Planctomycetota bacterium]